MTTRAAIELAQTATLVVLSITVLMLAITAWRRR